MRAAVAAAASEASTEVWPAVAHTACDGELLDGASSRTTAATNCALQQPFQPSGDLLGRSQFWHDGVACQVASRSTASRASGGALHKHGQPKTPWRRRWPPAGRRMGAVVAAPVTVSATPPPKPLPVVAL